MIRTAAHLLLLCCFWLTSIATVETPHTFYVSTTTIDLDPQTQLLQVTQKLFVDDLELCLGGTEQVPLRLGSENESKLALGLIRDYLEKHFVIHINDQKMTPFFLGYEYEADIIYCYTEYLYPASFNTLTIENTVFFDRIPEQKNMVQVSLNGWSKSLLLSKDHPKETIFN